MSRLYTFFKKIFKGLHSGNEIDVSESINGTEFYFFADGLSSYTIVDKTVFLDPDNIPVAICSFPAFGMYEAVIRLDGDNGDVMEVSMKADKNLTDIEIYLEALDPCDEETRNKVADLIAAASNAHHMQQIRAKTREKKK